VAGDELGNVRWHPVHDCVGDQDPAEVVGKEPKRLSAGIGEPGVSKGAGDQFADRGVR
jgi:hypothetical protein